MKRNISQNEANNLYIDNCVFNKLIGAEGLKPASFIMKSQKKNPKSFQILLKNEITLKHWEWTSQLQN